MQVSSIAAATAGGDGTLVFVEGKRNIGLMEGLVAAAVLCTPDWLKRLPPAIAVLVTQRPQYAFAMVGRLLYPDAASPRGNDGRNRHIAWRSCRSDGEP